MIEPAHLLHHIIRPVLKDLDLWSEPAERLILGTACQESECGRWLKQLGDGPANGIYQMEGKTEDDIHRNFIAYRPDLKDKIDSYYLLFNWDGSEQMIGNLYYATAMCRIHYLRAPEAIPDDLPGQAAYWKTYYNTRLGAGTVEGYIVSWNRFIRLGVF